MQTSTSTELSNEPVEPKAASAIDDGKDSLVRGIDSAVEALRERAENLPGGETVADAAYAAADSMESAADYLATRDAREIRADVRRFVKAHPGAILLTAGALGFLLARAFSRR